MCSAGGTGSVGGEARRTCAQSHLPNSFLRTLRLYTQRCIAALIVLIVLAAAAAPTWAQRSGHTMEQLEGVGIEQQMGETIPLDLTFTNEQGEAVQLGRYFDGERPVVLYMAYYDCPMLCPLMLEGLTATLKGMAWTPGEQYEVLTVSFNPRDTPRKARETKSIYIDQLDKYGAEEGWHFLTGDEEAIQKLTQSIGYSFRWIESEQEYAHPAAVLFLSGEGQIARYINGMQVPSDDARKALVEASDGEVGNVLDQAILYCFQFDPSENSYVADAFNLMRLGGVLTMLLLGGMLLFFWRRERHQLDEGEAAAGQTGEAFAYDTPRET